MNALHNPAANPASRRALLTLWIAFRFIVFGVGGFCLLMFSWAALIAQFTGDRIISPYLALMMGLAAPIAMLFGVGEWQRWAYVWVFLSTPILASLLGFISERVPGHMDSLLVAPFLIIVIVAPMPISYVFVNEYYQRKDTKRSLAVQNSPVLGGKTGKS